MELLNKDERIGIYLPEALRASGKNQAKDENLAQAHQV
jgi:hypothetical protein